MIFAGHRRKAIQAKLVDIGSLIMMIIIIIITIIIKVNLFIIIIKSLPGSSEARILSDHNKITFSITYLPMFNLRQ